MSGISPGPIDVAKLPQEALAGGGNGNWDMADLNAARRNLACVYAAYHAGAPVGSMVQDAEMILCRVLLSMGRLPEDAVPSDV